MIGRFWYEDTPSVAHISLALTWQDGEPHGRLKAPAYLCEQLEETFGYREDEAMRLPFALSYAVLLAAISGEKLTLTGDISVWPEEWGKLYHRSTGPISQIERRARLA